MADSGPSVLLLGAYSFVGRCIAFGLLDETDFTVAVTGRDATKLERVFGSRRGPRLSLEVLDAIDPVALARACRGADLVVNCVGPYIISGYAIARTVVESRKHYLDYAFEQFHYRRLGDLDAPAKEAAVALVTGAGETVGISSILCAHAAEKLPGIESVSIAFLEGALRDGESGFSSFMNGALEPALGNQDYLDGRYVVARMGKKIVERLFPEPYGTVRLLSDPSIDSLILPQRLGLRTVRNYFGVGMKIPFGFFPLMRLLNPYRNRLFYEGAARLVRSIMRRNHAVQTRATRPGREPLLAIDAETGASRLAIEVRFQGHFNGTAILPILICKMILGQEVRPCGLTTAFDLVTPARLLAEMERHRGLGRLSWTVSEPVPRTRVDG